MQFKFHGIPCKFSAFYRSLNISFSPLHTLQGKDFCGPYGLIERNFHLSNRTSHGMVCWLEVYLTVPKQLSCYPLKTYQRVSFTNILYFHFKDGLLFTVKTLRFTCLSIKLLCDKYTMTTDTSIKDQNTVTKTYTGISITL